MANTISGKYRYDTGPITSEYSSFNAYTLGDIRYNDGYDSETGVDLMGIDGMKKTVNKGSRILSEQYLAGGEGYGSDMYFVAILTNSSADSIVAYAIKSSAELGEDFYTYRYAFSNPEDMTDEIWNTIMGWFSTTLTTSTSQGVITISDGSQSILIDASNHNMKYNSDGARTNNTTTEYTTLQTNGWLIDGTYGPYDIPSQEDTARQSVVSSIMSKSKIVYTVSVSTLNGITTITDGNETILYNISNQGLLYNKDYYAEAPNATALGLLTGEGRTTDGSYGYVSIDNKKSDWDSIISLLKVSCISNATITHDIANHEITVANGNRSVTIMDRNLGATEYLGETPNNEALAYGDFHQRGNDYGFPSDPTTPITTSGNFATWGGDGYTSSTFITKYNPYSNGRIGDRRGQYLAPAGYHIPSGGQDSECEKLINFLKVIRPNSYVESLVTELLIPFSGLRNCDNAGNVEQQGALGQQGSLGFGLWTTATPNGSASFVIRVLFGGGNWTIYPSNLVGRGQGYSVRCFKNTSN